MLNRDNENVKSMLTDASETFLSPMVNLSELAEMIVTTTKPENSANIESPFGELQRFNTIWNSTVDLFSEEDKKYKQQLVLMIQLIEVPYKDYCIEPVLFSYDAERKNVEPITKQNMQRVLNVLKEHSRSLDGYRNDPEHILEIYRVGKDYRTLIGVYEAKSGMPVPTADGDCQIDGIDVDEYLLNNQEVRERLRVYITMLLDNKEKMCETASEGYRYQNVTERLRDFLQRVGGRADEESYRQCAGEPKQNIPDDIQEYIEICTPGMESDLVFGYLGKTSESPMLDNISVMYLPPKTKKVHGTDYRKDGDESDDDVYFSRVLLPPVRPLNEKYVDADISYIQEKNWIRVVVKVKNEVKEEIYQKIYSTANQDFNAVQPKTIVELYPDVPEDFVTKHIYYELPNTAELLSGAIESKDLTWKMLPEDNYQNIGKINSIQFDEQCSVCERRKKVKQIVLIGGIGEKKILGTIILPEANRTVDKETPVTVAIDNGASTSVRLVSTDGNHFKNYSLDGAPLQYSGMVKQITPCAEEELISIEQIFTNPISGNEQNYESMIQRHQITDGDFTVPIVCERLYSFKGEGRFNTLADDRETLSHLSRKIGVYPYPKTNLMRMNLKASSIKSYREAYKTQISQGLLTTIMALAKDGVAPCYNNLRICLAYPNSNLENISENAVKKVCIQAIDEVNCYLSESNQLTIGEETGSVSLYSESEASANWIKKEFTRLGEKVLVIDVGHSTTDIGLYVGDKLFGASVPCGGDEITLQTIADVYGNERSINSLLKCFNNIDTDDKQRVKLALEKTVTNKKPGIRLREVAGFSISLMYMLGNYKFSVTGNIVDDNQLLMQYVTELRLHMILPAIVQVIQRALEHKAITENQSIVIALTGKGAYAFLNTAEAFQTTFAENMRALLKYKGYSFTGRLEIKPPLDPEKKAIAKGMLDLWQGEEKGHKMTVIDAPDPIDTYLEIICGGDNKKVIEEKALIENSMSITSEKGYEQKKKEIYKKAFEDIIDGYTLDKFEEHFTTFCCSDKEFAMQDREIYRYVHTEFSGLRDTVKEAYEAYIMSLPGMENEQIAAALLSIGYEKLVSERNKELPD